MALKKFKPTTPSLRHTIITDRSSLWKGRPVKKLVVGTKSSGGRNNQGRITCRHKGGGVKNLYRKVDFVRSRLDEPAEVKRIEYDPNRSAFIALIEYNDSELSYIIAPQGLNIGDKVVSSSKTYISIGNCMPLDSIPNGTIIHNIELLPNQGAKLVRAAGSYAQLLSKASNYAVIKLKSGELRQISLNCRAVIGSVSNSNHQNRFDGKAGRSRWKGIRPTVRGVAMNPVDHPHGGGEGRTSGGRHPCSPWGWKTKGKKTRSTKKSNSFIVRHRKRNK